MENKYKNLLEDLLAIENEELTVSEAEDKIRTMVYEHANIAVSKASIMSIEELLKKLHTDFSSTDEVAIEEIEKRILKLIGGGK